ncbi:MAG: hypothetical protein SF069_08160 [Phycisphaerae bacterium]|nr:hypothetical protein [Phycisphaerae bacterium]
MALASGVAFLAAAATIFWLGFAAGHSFPTPLGAAAIILADVLVIGLSALLMWWLSKMLRQRRLIHAPESERRRMNRLRRIAVEPNAARRLPHRWLEHHLSTTRFIRPIAARAIRRIPPGWLVVVEGRRSRAESVKIAPAQQFEPLDLFRDFEAVAALASAYADSDIGKRDLADSRFHNSPVLFVVIFGALALFVAATQATKVIGGVLIGDLRSLAPLLMLPIPFALIFAVRQRPFSPRYWLIPGGVIIGRRFVRSNKAEIGRVTPKDTPLVLFCPGSPLAWAHFLYRGRHFSVEMNHSSVFGLAAGWLSTAAPPSDEQVQAFVNPE